MMYLEELYLTLGNYLLNTKTDDFLVANELPGIAHVDLYEGQYLHEEKEEVYPLPAIFIELSSASFTKKGRGIEQTTETIRFHIEQAKKQSTAMNRTHQAKALLPLRMVSAVHAILSGFLGLQPVSRELDTEFEGYPVHILELVGTFENKDTDKFGGFEQTSIKGVEIKKQMKYTL